MHFRKKNQHVWEKILIDGVLHQRSHSIPLKSWLLNCCGVGHGLIIVALLYLLTGLHQENFRGKLVKIPNSQISNIFVGHIQLWIIGRIFMCRVCNSAIYLACKYFFRNILMSPPFDEWNPVKINISWPDIK